MNNNFELNLQTYQIQINRTSKTKKNRAGLGPGLTSKTDPGLFDGPMFQARSTTVVLNI